MHPPTQSERELFLVLKNLGERFSHFLKHLPLLSRAHVWEQLDCVTISYKKNRDLALVCLGFDLGGFSGEQELDFKELIGLATLGGISVIDPERLNDNDQDRFYSNYLQGFSLSATNRDSPALALAALGRLIVSSHSATSIVMAKPEGIEFLYKRKPGKGRALRAKRLSTVGARPEHKKRARTRLGRGTVQLDSSGSPISTDAGLEHEGVLIRYQRGDTWMPARLRNLTTQEVRLAASAAPASGSTIRVSIEIGKHRAMLVGTVVQVINTEGSVDGSTTFRLSFIDVTSKTKERLVALLTAAKQQGLSLTPPPPRKNRRFAIAWPVLMKKKDSKFSVAALDISERGLFVATNSTINAPIDSEVLFSLPLDRHGQHVSGRATVARAVDEKMARERGLSLGYGLYIEEFDSATQEQFADFVMRVRQRSQRHILVAGASERSQRLAESFHSAGYVVSQASSVETMHHRIHFESCPPDIAVLDDAAISPELRSTFETTFSEYGVPVVQFSGQAPHVARNTLDQMINL